MIDAVGMDASGKALRFIGVAGRAFDRRDLVGVRITLDVGVAVLALEDSVNAGAKLVSVDADAVARCILHARVGVACKAIAIGLSHSGGCA
jgi:hypothetical protein